MNANAILKFEGDVIQLNVPPSEIDNSEGGKGIEITIPGYKNNPEDPHGAQIFIEVYQGKVRVHVWNGTVNAVTTEIDPQ